MHFSFCCICVFQYCFMTSTTHSHMRFIEAYTNGVQIDTPAIFYCYSGKHIIEDAVILSCCSKVIGCRTHILELASENDHRCPECKEEITMKTIHSLPVLDHSIQIFVPQEKAVTSLMQRLSSTPSKVSLQNESRGDESSRNRERSRSRRSSHHDHSHHHSSHYEHSDRRSHHHQLVPLE